MREQPETRFARNGDVHLAYQVVGTGPTDLLLIDSWVHHVEVVWEIPEWARLLRRLSSFTRLIHFDRRGTGLSDPIPLDELPDLETQVEDAIAVLDAAGSERPAMFGVQDGTLIAMLLAAMHPGRCGPLVMYSATVGGHSWAPESIDEMVQAIRHDLALHGEAGACPSSPRAESATSASSPSSPASSGPPSGRAPSATTFDGPWCSMLGTSSR